MDVTRTVKVPHTIYTLTEHARARAAHADVGTRADDSTRAPTSSASRRSTAPGNRVVYGAPNAFVGRSPEGRRRARAGDRRGLRRSRATCPARSRASTSRPTSRRSTMRVFHSGPEQVVTYADNQIAGVDVGDAADDARLVAAWQSEPHTISLPHPERAERPLLRPVRARPDGRVGYAPFVVRPAVARGDRPRARRPADEHLAGLQLPGRRRRRLRRHLVRRAAEPHRRPRRAPTSRAACRRASTATTCRSCTGSTGRARAPSSSPTPTSTRSRTATTSRARTTWSSSRVTRST